MNQTIAGVSAAVLLILRKNLWSLIALVNILLVLSFCSFSVAQEPSNTPNQKTVDWSGFFPEGEARGYVLSYCITCHDLSRVVVQQKDQGAWEGTLSGMVGDMAANDQIESMAQYLAEHFGPDNPIKQLPVNINEASISEVLRLPGMSKAEAGQIVAYRTEKGKFNSLDELGQIIGSKELETIREFIMAE